MDSIVQFDDHFGGHLDEKSSEKLIFELGQEIDKSNAYMKYGSLWMQYFYQSLTQVWIWFLFDVRLQLPRWPPKLLPTLCIIVSD